MVPASIWRSILPFMFPQTYLPRYVALVTPAEATHLTQFPYIYLSSPAQIYWATQLKVETSCLSLPPSGRGILPY